MKAILVSLCSVAMLFSGCATTSPSKTPTEIAQEAQPFVRPGVAAVTSVVLLYQEPDRRTEIAKYLYAASVAVYTLATGTAPTPGDLETALDTMKPNNEDAQAYADVVRMVLSIYAGVYPSVQTRTPAVVQQIVNDVAAGLQDAASTYIPKE